MKFGGKSEMVLIFIEGDSPQATDIMPFPGNVQLKLFYMSIKKINFMNLNM